MKNTEKKQYLTPELKVIEFEVELGYAASQTFNNPSNTERFNMTFFSDNATGQGTQTGAAFDREISQNDWLQ